MSDLSDKKFQLHSGEEAASRNSALIELPTEQSLAERFEAIVQRYPERLAIKMRERSLNYRELNRRANEIGRAIAFPSHSVEKPVALLFEHGIDVIASGLGALKAKKYYIVLDPALPISRLQGMMRYAAAGVIVSNTNHWDLARSLAAGRAVSLNIDDLTHAASTGNLGLPIGGDDPAIMTYTTGSTGEPKPIITIIAPFWIRLRSMQRSGG